ncbi:roadblock/LC7 domain-containing protein [Methanoregula sp.]|uniref:roadblock/LC7 domain-containing protein n=1 Tax=Methanoregula sp. TaxID=2052170 RepID=UPI0035659883
MLKDKIAVFIEKIRAIDGVTGCALVSRDGIITGKYFDRELNEPWFGALAATILASAESAGTLIGIKSLSAITIRAADSSILVMGAGDHFLIAAVIKGTVKQDVVCSHIGAVASEIGRVM